MKDEPYRDVRLLPWDNEPVWRVGGDSWTFSTATNRDVEFCVWTLLRDGLQVPPFDRHPDGDGGLRGAGLTAAAWWTWFTAVVDGAAGFDGRRQSEYIERLEGHFREKGAPPTTQELANLAPLPHLAPSALDLWAGSAELRQTLGDLHRMYGADREERNERERELFERTFSTGGDRGAERSRRLWDQVQRYRPLPPLFFYQVDYPEPVLVVMPPAAAVFGGVHPVVDADPAYESLVLRAAAQLAAQ
jgi:hypothetical protein